MTTKTDKLLNAFHRGDELTTKQIRSRFKLANPSSTIDRLRGYGFRIPLSRTENGKNVYYIKD